MKIPLINQFHTPHQTININTPDDAVIYLLNKNRDIAERKILENYIKESLVNNLSDYKTARDMMNSRTPRILSSYQNHYSTKINMTKVDKAITTASNNNFLSDNQILFHGGQILNNINVGESFTTSRPLSTSLCPKKALHNGEHLGKYYNYNCVNLIILTVKNIQQPAFIFRISGTNKGDEKEVLIHSGAILKVVNKTLINSNYSVWGYDSNRGYSLEKQLPAYLIEADIS